MDKNLLKTEEGAKDERKKKGLITRGLMTKSGMLIVLSGVLLVLVLVGTAAWYTRVTDVTGMTFEVADFDFNVNYVSNDFIITAQDFMNVADSEQSGLTNDRRKVAPGASGVIPIRISSTAETGVEYALEVDMFRMAEEFRKRLRFFYYTYDEETDKYTEHTIYEDDEDAILTGTIPVNETVIYEYVYWEWVYELDEEWFYNDGSYPAIASATSLNRWTSSTDTDLITEEQKKEFDRFDTNIALGEYDDWFVSPYTTCPVASISDLPTLDDIASETSLGGEVEDLLGYTVYKADEDANGLEDGKLYAYQKAMYAVVSIGGSSAVPEVNLPTGTYPDGTGRLLPDDITEDRIITEREQLLGLE